MDASVSRLDSQSVGQAVGRSVGWSVGQSVCGDAVGRTFDQLGGRWKKLSFRSNLYSTKQGLQHASWQLTLQWFTVQTKHAGQSRATRWVRLVVAWVSHVTQNVLSGVSCLTQQFEWVVLNALLCVRAAVYPL